MNDSNTAPDTPWRAGRLDARGGPKRVLFGRVYEDVAIELAAFAPMAGKPVFCIASAGCTALALAQQHPVTAVDINPVQLDYARERLAGAPMQLGTAERLMAIGRTALAPFGWRRASLTRFADMDDPVEQVNTWRTEFETRPVRWLMDLGFSVSNLKLVYSAPLLACLPDRLGEVMRARLRRTFAQHPNARNPYLRALLLGDPDPLAPTPPHPIEFVCRDAASYLEGCEPGSVAGIALSNILDGAPAAYRERLYAAVRRAAAPGAMVVQRSFSEPGFFHGGRDEGFNVAARDRSVLWGVVDVRPADRLAT